MKVVKLNGPLNDGSVSIGLGRTNTFSNAGMHESGFQPVQPIQSFPAVLRPIKHGDLL